MDNDVAYFSSIRDPRMKCLTCLRTVYEPKKLFAVYRFQYQGQNGEPGTDVDYCVNLTTTKSVRFGFSPCEDGDISSTGQGYFFDGKSCYVGRYPLLGNEPCLLWVKKDFKDSVSEECVAQFDNNCGPQRYTLYDKDQCS
ncbi:hypothetical protein V5799_024698 [Amblyomma americanum]|uniref:Lipocalin n=1 Tax=Amblyomma americanum TaxID=6943 RepID=A0AAQ4EBB4_AMBAM